MRVYLVVALRATAWVKGALCKIVVKVLASPRRLAQRRKYAAAINVIIVLRNGTLPTGKYRAETKPTSHTHHML